VLVSWKAAFSVVLLRGGFLRIVAKHRRHVQTMEARMCLTNVDFPIGGFSPPEGRLARGFKPPAFSRFLFQSAVKPAESF